MKTGSPKEIYAMSGMSVHGLCNLIGQPAQAQSIVDGFNYVVEQKGLKKVHFISGLYAEDEVRRDPDKGKVQGILFQGEPGKPVAVLIAGGGFDGVASYLESIPAAMELHRRGYSAFVLVYRVNVELHETEPQAKGGEASKDVLPAVRYLIGHQAEYGYTMDGFGMFGFSAGGLMTTAYAFSDYKTAAINIICQGPPPSSPSMACTGSLRFTRRTRGLLYFPGSGGMTLPVLRPWRRSSRTSGKRWGRKMSISSCMISWVMALAWG